MQNNIFKAKILVKSSKKKEFITDIPDIEVMQICNATSMLLKYNQHLNTIENEVVIALRL